MQNTKEEEKEQKYTLIGARLKRLRETKTEGEKRRFMSQEELADVLHISRITLQRYESGNKEIVEKEIRRIAKYFKAPFQYLIGETDIDDIMAYSYYIQTENIETEHALSLAEDEYIANRNAMIAKNKLFFSMCGYQYDNIEGTAEYDFSDITGSAHFAGPHKLIDPRGINEPTYLSDEDLKSIQSRLCNYITFECFHINRERVDVNGDS